MQCQNSKAELSRCHIKIGQHVKRNGKFSNQNPFLESKFAVSSTVATKQSPTMQLVQENNRYLTMAKELNGPGRGMREAPSEHQLLKDKQQSAASLLKMNPVASGDNVATALSSAHKLKEETPPLVPCCEGKELRISQDLVRTGLSAISVKHNCAVIQCFSLSSAAETLQVAPGIVKHRNSFRSLHRPDLKRVPYLRRMTPVELETLFRGYSDMPKRSLSNDDKRQEAAKITVSEKKDGVRSKSPKKVGSQVVSSVVSRSEDVPAGMRLHGARARLYTSVLAGATTGDHEDAISLNDELDVPVPQLEEPAEEQLTEELQIILPPRAEDVLAESTITQCSEYSTRSSDIYRALARILGNASRLFGALAPRPFSVAAGLERTDHTPTADCQFQALRTMKYKDQKQSHRDHVEVKTRHKTKRTQNSLRQTRKFLAYLSWMVNAFLKVS